jgi:hypothetical protein
VRDGHAASRVRCSACRSLRGFSPRYLDCAEDIAAGEREPLLGLLEDCHRYYDGAPPAPFVTPPHATPYFGEHVPPLQHPSVVAADAAARAVSSSGAAAVAVSRAGPTSPAVLRSAHVLSRADASALSPPRRGMQLPGHSRAADVDIVPDRSGLTPSYQRDAGAALESRPPWTDAIPPPPPPPTANARSTALRPWRVDVADIGSDVPVASPATDGIPVTKHDDFITEEFVFTDASCDAAVVFQWLKDIGIPLRRPWELLVSGHCGVVAALAA